MLVLLALQATLGGVYTFTEATTATAPAAGGIPQASVGTGLVGAQPIIPDA